MVVLIVVLTILVFIAVDVSTRLILRRLAEARIREERRKALEVGLRLEFSDEAPSLKRVAVETPKARILAVDDEPVVLDTFRKILVLAGYAVDTVETGKEALGLVQKGDYDFVFTDLKMPDMDGLEVTKAVKHLRPDIDVAMITGYATIESAVETMRFGAMDYVEKPFTEDELVAFTDKLLFRRQDRLEKQAAPTVQLVTGRAAESRSSHVVNVPGGLFVSPQHVWLSVETTGEVRIGLDDFVHKTLGVFDEILFPKQGARVRRGKPLFSVKQGGRLLAFPSPVSGRVESVNHELAYQLDAVTLRPFQHGWICCLRAANLSPDLEGLRIGADSLRWYEEEIGSLQGAVKRRREGLAHDQALAEDESELQRRITWEAFEAAFLPAPGEPVAATATEPPVATP